LTGTPYVGATVDMYAGPGGYRGEFMAWDPVKQKKVWAIIWCVCYIIPEIAGNMELTRYGSRPSAALSSGSVYSDELRVCAGRFDSPE
jgi:hypothetical protein